MAKKTPADRLDEVYNLILAAVETSKVLAISSPEEKYRHEHMKNVRDLLDTATNLIKIESGPAKALPTKNHIQIGTQQTINMTREQILKSMPEPSYEMIDSEPNEEE